MSYNPDETRYDPDDEASSTEAGDVAEQVDEEQEKGYRGTTPDPHPNEDYSLESGPDSPPAVEDPYTRTTQPSVRPDDEDETEG